ncbi:MAG TPA: hydrogenase maturation nickel metallochaperone HypA [Vicinamibacterales bacterium]|nr:hydrogenase maturation nickel metallochaperone HypA [Vicinamibacterales bacterium]
MSIAESILDSVRRQAALHGGRRVSRIGVVVGETSGVNADALGFCFEIVVRGTEFEGVALDLEAVSVRFRCEACQHEFTPADFDPRCPACAAERGRLVAGEELALSYLELQD